jgi:Subtilase family/Divergent InlB B-repeat domain
MHHRPKLAMGALVALALAAAATAPAARQAEALAPSNVPLPGTPQLDPPPAGADADLTEFESAYTLEAMYAAEQDAPVRVCVVDSGVNPTPADQSQIVQGANVVDGSTNTVDNSELRHGTHMAAVIAEKAPNAIIVPVKDTNDDSGPGYSTYDLITAAIYKSVALGCQVINVSQGDDPINGVSWPPFNSAVSYAIASGEKVVLAAGNAARGDAAGNYLASDNPEAIRVGFELNLIGGVRQLGPSSNYGQLMDLAAPNPFPVIDENGVPAEEVQSSTGAAEVSGTAAMVLGMPGNASLSPETLKSCLLQGGVSISNPHGGTVVGLSDWGALTFCGYNPPTAALTVITKGKGSITDDLNVLNCAGVKCTGTAYAGAPDPLTAIADDGWLFAGWSVPSCGKKPVCPVAVNGQTVTATFVPAKVHLSVTKAGSGKGAVVTTFGTCAAAKLRCLYKAVSSRPTIQLSAKASPPDKRYSYRFIRWGGDCSGTKSTCVIKSKPAVKVTAVFARRAKV